MTRTAIARPPPMDIEDGWRRLAAGFQKLLRILDGEERLSFSGAEYSELLQYGTLFFSTSFCFFLFSLGFNLTHIDMGRLPRRRITYKLCYESPAVTPRRCMIGGIRQSGITSFIRYVPPFPVPPAPAIIINFYSAHLINV